MKEILPRPRNTLLVFHFECIPDKATWPEEKYAGAYVNCFLDRNINNMQELFDAKTAARDFLAKCGWIVKEQLEEPLWQKLPSRFCCFFSKVLTARRLAMEIARQDGISLIAFSWENDDNGPEENK